jgi:hypothetical protein
VKLVRDLVVARVQISVQWSNRDAFVEELTRAHDGTVTEGDMAKFFHSHSKTICPILPSAFLSNCKKQRRAPRPQKCSTRNLQEDLWQASDSESESSTRMTLLPDSGQNETPGNQCDVTSSSRDWLGHLSDDGTWAPTDISLCLQTPI